MPHRSSRIVTLADWPPVFRYLIRSAELECPRGHADALRDFTALAMRKVPARGVFDPAVRGEHELYAAIDSVARAHLELGNARAAWRAALKRADLDLDVRDALEQAALEVQNVSDTAYFYAGLTFGVALVSGYRSV
jgi:hypothetical protein